MAKSFPISSLNPTAKLYREYTASEIKNMTDVEYAKTFPITLVSRNETAKMVRQCLKEAFPEIKFVVRGKRAGAGLGPYLRIEWEGGPSVRCVRDIIDVFEGRSHRPRNNNRRHLDGKYLQFDVNAIFYDQRHRSLEDERSALERLRTQRHRAPWDEELKSLYLQKRSEFEALEAAEEKKWAARWSPLENSIDRLKDW